jgi:predicted dehydrogenase
MLRRQLLAGGAAALASAQAASPAKIGIIGTGNRSTAHVKAYLNMPEIQVVAMSDLDSSKMQATNKRLGTNATTYTDWRELIKDKNVSIVVIAVPNYLHREMALAAMRAGKDVMLEKPIAVNEKEAQEIRREAERLGRVLGIGMQRRYWEADSHVQQLVDNGVIGTLRFIVMNEYRGDWSPTAWQYTDPATGKKTNWRFLKKLAGSTELEFSVHGFGQVTQLVRSPLSRCVASGGSVHYSGRDMRDVCNGLIDFENGVRFNYSFCLFSKGTPGSQVIIGDKGTLRRIDRGELVLDTPTKSNQKPPPLTGHSGEIPEVLLYREFLKAVAERRQPEVNAKVAIDAARIAYAMEIAITENRVVTGRDFA